MALPALNTIDSHWSLEEASGVRVDDVTATGNDLADNNTVTQETGIIGNSTFHVRANEEFLSISDASQSLLSPGDADFSFVIWIYLTSKANTLDIISKFSSGQEEYVLLYADVLDQIQWFINDGVSNISSVLDASGISAAEWHMLTVYHDSVNNLMAVALDDGNFTTTAISGGVNTGTAAFELAHRTGETTFYDGRLDQAMKLNIVLTKDEKDSIYNSGSGTAFSAYSVPAVDDTETIVRRLGGLRRRFV